MVNFTYTIEGLEWKNTENKEVTFASWRCTATDGVNTAFEHCDFVFDAPDPNSDDYVQLENLTEEKVWEWLEPNLNKAEIEQNLTNQLEELANPALLYGKPWES